MATPFTADHAMMLLDFSQKLDIALLETVINAFYNSVGPEVSEHMLNHWSRGKERGLTYNLPPSSHL